MLDRLLKIPMSKINFKKELNTIVNIALRNGYSKDFIYRMLRSKNKKYALNLVYPQSSQEKKIWKKIPYLKKTANKIKDTLRKHNVSPAFYNKKTLKNFLINNKLKPKVDKIEKSGIYSIQCNDCNAVYIGKTKRSLKIRYKEHVSSALHNRPTSGISKHLVDSGHTTSMEKLKLIKNVEGGRIQDKYEIYYINSENRKGSFLVNDQVDFFNNSPLLCMYL